ncbi:MAG: GGDEF domain-containing protein [Desulfovibrio sp.]|nr:GGDEF domain-containing protein [Desulfovibrio sp.]
MDISDIYRQDRGVAEGGVRRGGSAFPPGRYLMQNELLNMPPVAVQQQSFSEAYPPTGVGTQLPAEPATLAAEAVEYLLQVISAPQFSTESPPDALRSIKNFEELLSIAWAVRNMSTALSNGNLDYSPPVEGITIDALKSFQVKLRRLAWQIKQIAGGDYNNKEFFIDECAEALNHLTRQLAQRISTLTKTSEEYRNMSFRDALTGIYNRKAFMHFAEEVFSALRPAVSTLIIADIDRFKIFNDTYGHLCGDEVLKLFAAHIARALRPDDICCRYGGEEFLMLLPGMPLDLGLSVAERLRAGVEKLRLRFAGHELLITSSFGVCEAGPIPENLSFNDFICACISRADVNLYKAKAGGRNMVVG